MTPATDNFCRDYARRHQEALALAPIAAICELAAALQSALGTGRQVFLAGNGGSAANAIHLANDLQYAIGKDGTAGIRAEALTANQSVLTCLANDISYDEVFAHQLRIKGEAGDILIVLSGSGNSANVVRAIEAANDLGMRTFAILGFSGGRCRELVQVPIHFAVDDMQIAEDLQLTVGHMCFQWVRSRLPREREMAV
jgi:D-sedoheptulose 7-phosphate isomerase